MSDHEFEKKVQLKMDELKFRPSDAVWLGVEKKIRKDKRRRRLMLWLPILLLGLSAGGYLLLRGDYNPNNSTLQQPTTATSEATENNSTATKPEKEAPANNNRPAEKIKQPEVAIQPAATQEKQQPPVLVINNRKKNKRREKQQITFENPVEERVTPHIDFAVTGHKELPELLLHSSAVEKDPYDLSFNTTPENVPATAMLANINLGSMKHYIIRPVKKWQFGVQASGGFSNISKNSFLSLRDIFQGQKSLVEDLAAAPAPPTGIINGSYNLSINPPLSRQSDIRSGYFYAVEAFAKKPLSRRFSLSLGLQYAYYSVQTTTGRLVNSTRSVNIGQSNSQLVNQYYAGHLEENYINRYHFIGVPVVINFQLNKSRKMPVVLDGGLSLSHLLSSNALHFDGVSGIYYKDNSLLNRTQLSLVTGLNVGLWQNSKHPVTIGPSLRYSFTGTVKKNVSAGQYLWSTGLSVKMLLKK